MMVPDYALIGEIMFFAYGFGIAKECGAKMVTTFKLCSEQCSSQPHYDYGERQDDDDDDESVGFQKEKGVERCKRGEKRGEGGMAGTSVKKSRYEEEI